MAGELLRIAMLGMRGVPARYGGLETVAEELGARLAARGHDVSVYCRARFDGDAGATYRGMRRIVLPSLPQKHLDTPSHTALASARALLRRADVVHVFGVGNAAWLPVLRRGARATVISVDGMDWRRRKWGRLPRALLERSAGIAVRMSDACITDSAPVQRWYAQRYGRTPDYVPHGIDVTAVPTRAALERYGLRERGYVLFVGRITPEKGVHHLLEAFAGLPDDLALVVVGDGSGDPAYWRRLEAAAGRDPRVRLLGPLYGEPVRELYAHAWAYVQPSEVEGTALSVVEAMGFGNCVVVSGIPENAETVGDAGITYDPARPVEALRDTLRGLLESPEAVEGYRNAASAYAQAQYSWERVTDAHEAIYYRVLGGR